LSACGRTSEAEIDLRGRQMEGSLGNYSPPASQASVAGLVGNGLRSLAQKGTIEGVDKKVSP